MTEQSAPQPPARDPWKGLRGVMAGTLVMEAIVVGLALPVVHRFGGGLSSTNGVLVVGLAVAMVLASGFVGRSWGLGLALALQALMVLTFFISPALGALGVLFALVWACILWLRRDVARRLSQGTSPGPR
ncbi:Protein of unknown function (DUF4233) [Streptoalloteichus tenebrarius]|uniref:Integral membrane protein n=1 Tax=Streptoalloteichus tenebrarius (strain ATCC 17920 / DSM 40477 / JCM 4838 / CBS 697.72 / NBRC 16177 / NCIMB 11028 / NRRL B-12390 / A12253. 1 / ISP 5477) TaxID=1933 RepID=A0ABT1HX89_STRSD|nr:DUF4233 domain-containing protein [Streptoalloteichus tenebrarius]MCP2260125.1 Protein of unknown function (DUF4233) [Streptoalloteichus tenebrarius]BFF00551.1 DUF4233 domain-containing protein [Streptoalloteichus tenebrarius]